jgi:hypothetical protein
MANHVNSYLYFREINEAGVEILKKLGERFDKFKDGSHECHLGHVFVDDLDGVDREFMTEKIGAKWAYAQDWDTTGISMYSAWCAPMDFVDYLVEEVAKVDPESIAVFTYEDEMPNFIGAQVYCGGEIYDGDEIDDEHIRNNLLRRQEDLREIWDDVEEEWQDDGDLYFEYIWEYIESWQGDLVWDCLKQIDEEKNVQ